jgi:UDP-glucose 4-epimerase
MPRILVTGGAGYIGSHTSRHLIEAGHEVVVIDDLSAGHRRAVPPTATLVEQSLADGDGLHRVFDEHRPDAIIHFAARIEAGLSMTDPRAFYQNNIVNALNLADAAVAHGNTPLVFSSSAAVYGEPPVNPINEDTPKQPTNVYGETKLAYERVLASYDRAYGLRSISLRYFNACGASPDGANGPDHRTKTLLITRAMLNVLGQADVIQVFGTDYPTPDGTAIRDYIHVEDLAAAHVLALDALFGGAATTAYNVGVGRGFSVREVLDAVERVTGRPLNRVLAPRRAGDPSALVADAGRIADELGWKAVYPDLDQIVETAWRWHSTHPDGFGD